MCSNPNLCVVILLVFSVSTTLYSADSAQAMQEWKVLADLSTAERVSFMSPMATGSLIRQLRQEEPWLEDLYVTNSFMGQYGLNFSYLGRIEGEYLKFLQSSDVDNGEPKTVFIPGCGIGRAILDGLKKTKHYQFIANDLSKDAGDTLGKAIKRWFPEDQKRVTIDNGDALVLLPTLPDSSVDVVFCANLIHFFNPDQLDRFFQECQRVLKPKGRIYLLWNGFDSSCMKNPDQNFQVYINLMRKFEAAGVEYPTYIDGTLFCKKLEKELTFIGEYTRNYIQKHEVIGLAKNLGLSEVYYQRYSYKKISSDVYKNHPTRGTRRDIFICGDYNLESAIINDALILEKNQETLPLATSSYGNNFTNGTWKAHVESHLCDECNDFEKNIKKCSRCKVAKYCGKECQTKAWPLHKNSCDKKN